MKLQRENKFKKMIVSNIYKGLIIAGIGVLGFSFFPTAFKLLDIHFSNNKQNDVVAAAINPDYNSNSDIIYDNNQNNLTDSETATPIEETNKYDFEKLRETNPNIIAIIEGSCFEGGYYPVVATNSNDDMTYYTRHSIDNQYSVTGTLFMDCTNNKDDQVTRIWGHNFNNDGKNMFTGLANTCQDQATFDNTLRNDNSLKLYTEDGEYDLYVAACIINDPRTQGLGNYGDQNAFLNDMTNIQNSSVIQTDTKIEANDEVLILSTCTDIGSTNDSYNRISVYCKKTPTKIYQMNQGKTL